jgi:nucleoside 2-deoxyribosyltransferase
MSRPSVYLAGPITGLSFQGATSWRHYARDFLADRGIEAFSPLRGKEYLARLQEPISGHGREYAHLGTLSTPPAVIARDHFDVHRVDLVLAYLHGATAVSIGTCFELAWALHARKPVVGVFDGPHDHMFVDAAVAFRCNDLESALHTCVSILRP